MFGFAEAFAECRQKITCAIKHGVPKTLNFCRGNKDQDDIGDENFDLVILRLLRKNRCGSEKIMNLDAPIINIDHHPDNENFGLINIVDHKKSSVAELIYDFFLHHKWPINKDIATCLLTDYYGHRLPSCIPILKIPPCVSPGH